MSTLDFGDIPEFGASKKTPSAPEKGLTYRRAPQPIYLTGFRLNTRAILTLSAYFYLLRLSFNFLDNLLWFLLPAPHLQSIGGGF